MWSKREAFSTGANAGLDAEQRRLIQPFMLRKASSSQGTDFSQRHTAIGTIELEVCETKGT
jgi:hypothetical protein